MLEIWRLEELEIVLPYPTILYLIIGDLACNILTARMPLWSYNLNWLNNISTDFLITAFIYPCTVILFLTYYPKLLKKQVAYLLLWVFIYSLAEYLATIVQSVVPLQRAWNLFNADI